MLPPVIKSTNGTTDIFLSMGGYNPVPVPEPAGNQTIAQATLNVQAAIKKGPLWPYVSSAAAYHCPGDLRTRLKPGSGWAYDSYSKADPMGTGSWGGLKPFLKLSQMTSSSQSMYFIEESDPRGFNAGTWVIDVSPPGWVDPFTVFHGNVSDLSFGDGHVEAHRWIDENQYPSPARSYPVHPAAQLAKKQIPRP